MIIKEMYGKFWISSLENFTMAEILAEGERFLKESAKNFPEHVIGPFDTLKEATDALGMIKS
jgi:hypothetical protein